MLGTVASKRPLKRLVAAMFVVALGFCLICGKVLLDARHAAGERATEIATNLVATLSADIARDIESFDLSLQGVIDGLEFPEITKVSPALRQAILFDRSATAKHLYAIELLDENGNVRLDSRNPFPEPVSSAGADYFEVHKNSDSPEVFISGPNFVSPATGYVIAISRRLSHPDGSFAGVIVGAIRLSYFRNLFKAASLGPGGNITLSRADGRLLMRWPYEEAMLGRDLKGAELYKRLAVAPRGHFETFAVTDGVHRLIAYSRIGDLPLVVGAGQSTADIYAEWRRYALTIAALMALVCAMGIVLVWYLIREMNRRNAVESTLAVLARTDGLTGLANRRHFNEAIAREWRRAQRERSPLALVMCDADMFKTYNDRHGHQAGDDLLQAIGTAMTLCTRRGADIAARYGGDEFAILLPGMSSNDAARIAEQVRRYFAAACAEGAIAPSTLSIGVASLVPDRDQDQSALIAAADEAAYRAKKLGRDRFEIAPACKLGLVAA